MIEHVLDQDTGKWISVESAQQQEREQERFDEKMYGPNADRCPLHGCTLVAGIGTFDPQTKQSTWTPGPICPECARKQ